MKKTYAIVVCATVDGIPGHTIIELYEDNTCNVLSFPTLQKAEAFSFFLEGLGYTREK
jgi:hypothetical protein